MTDDRTNEAPPAAAGVKAAWQVTAGVIPGIPDEQYSRTWVLSSGEGQFRADEYSEDAMAYYAELLNPERVNWVRIDWVWI